MSITARMSRRQAALAARRWTAMRKPIPRLAAWMGAAVEDRSLNKTRIGSFWVNGALERTSRTRDSEPETTPELGGGGGI